jgi:hypothetical protein
MQNPTASNNSASSINKRYSISLPPIPLAQKSDSKLVGQGTAYPRSLSGSARPSMSGSWRASLPTDRTMKVRGSGLPRRKLTSSVKRCWLLVNAYLGSPQRSRASQRISGLPLESQSTGSLPIISPMYRSRKICPLIALPDKQKRRQSVLPPTARPCYHP